MARSNTVSSKKAAAVQDKPVRPASRLDNRSDKAESLDIPYDDRKFTDKAFEKFRVQCPVVEAYAEEPEESSMKEDSMPIVVDNKPAKENLATAVRKYEVSPEGEVNGVAIFGADLGMLTAYLRFVRDGLGMDSVMPIAVLGGLGSLMSPLSMKSASDFVKGVEELVSKGKVDRVVCIASRNDLDVPIVRHLLHVPDGKDFAAQALAMVRTRVKGRLGVNVEFYLADVKDDGEVEFFRLD